MELLDGAISAPMTSVKQMARAHGDIGREAESGQHVGVMVLVSAGCGNRCERSRLSSALVTRMRSDTAGWLKTGFAVTAAAVTPVSETAERRRRSGDAVGVTGQRAGDLRVVGPGFRHSNASSARGRRRDRYGMATTRTTAQRPSATGNDSGHACGYRRSTCGPMKRTVVLRWTEECLREGFVRCWPLGDCTLRAAASVAGDRSSLDGSSRSGDRLISGRC